VTAADVAAFLRVVAAVEEEAHARTPRSAAAADRGARRRRKPVRARASSRA